MSGCLWCDMGWPTTYEGDRVCGSCGAEWGSIEIESETEVLKYECDECNQIYETTDQHLIYCDSEKCVDKDVKLHRLHEL